MPLCHSCSVAPEVLNCGISRTNSYSSIKCEDRIISQKHGLCNIWKYRFVSICLMYVVLIYKMKMHKTSVEIFVKLLSTLNDECFLEMKRKALWDVWVSLTYLPVCKVWMDEVHSTFQKHQVWVFNSYFICAAISSSWSWLLQLNVKIIHFVIF